MARTTKPYEALFAELDQQVPAEDEIAVRIWGLTGWSLNWWLILTWAFGLLLVLPFILGLKHPIAVTMHGCSAS